MKQLHSLITGVALALVIIITFALIIGEFKQSIQQMDREISNGSKMDHKLMLIKSTIKE